MINKPINWIGKSGKKYPYNEYNNHGYGGIKQGFKDLPKDDYPYTLEYLPTIIPILQKSKENEKT